MSGSPLPVPPLPPSTLDRALVALGALVLESAAVGAALLDADLRYLQVNAMLAAMNGRPAAAHVGRRVRDVLPAAAAEAMEASLRQVLASGEPVLDAPYVLREPGAEPRHFLCSFQAVPGPDGVPAAIAVFVSERTPAEAVLREAMLAAEAERARLGRLVAQIPAPVAMLEGPELRFRALSGAYQAIIGGRPVLGRPIREALPELWGGAGGTDFFALMERAYRHGEPVVRTNERAMWDGDGDGVAEEHVVDLVYAPLVAGGAGADEVEGVVVLVHDVTARVRAEHALRESEARFRNMADAAPVMLWLTDPDGRCLFLNRAWLSYTGQTLADGLGYGWLEAVHPEDRAAAERAFRDANAGRTGFRVDYRLRRHDGAYRWAIDSAAPRLGPDGEYLGYVGSVIDIDERAQLLDAERVARTLAETARHEADDARREAEAANRGKSEFLAVMSHELRTPLNAIQGYAELMELGIHGPVTPAQQEALRRIQTSQRHLLGLVNGVLNYARVETGNVHYALGEVRLAVVLVACEALVTPQAQQKEIRLDFPRDLAAPGAAPLAVRADREKVQQIVLNLLSNAVKFTDAGGAVTVRAAARGDLVQLAVRDTGVGIAPDQLDRIFEPFVQVDARLTRAHEGVGLGLAISRDLARGMGGELTAESAPGRGSTFTLVLPRG